MDLKRPISWSAMSSFEYSPEQWYQKYVIHGKCRRATETEAAICYIFEQVFASRCPQVETSPEMEFGKLVGDRLASDPLYLPHVPRLSHFEYELRKVKFGKIELIGFIDSYEPHTALEEYKTGKKAWDQKRADEHGQISFYLLCLNLLHRVRPEDVSCTIRWMPTRDNGDFSISFINEKDVKSFPTKRTTRQVLEFGQRINQTYAAMQAYAKNHE